MKYSRFLTVLPLLLSPACSSVPSTGTASNPDSAAPAAPEDHSLGVLSDAQLPERSCGMILWTLDDQHPAAVFRYVAGKEADIVLGETPVRLTRTDYHGSSGFGVFESQIFENADAGVRVEVTSRFGMEFDGGAYLERGLIKVQVPDGWSIVAPAAGIAGCRS